jgi:hypothetical protein
VRFHAQVILLTWPLVVAAQAPNLRLVRGQVTEVGGGNITIRDTFLRPSLCALPDSAEQLTSAGTQPAPTIATGSYVEAIVEQSGDSCSVRTLYIRPPRPAITPSTASNQNFLDNLFPRGNLVYTGTVQVLSERRLELRSRRGERRQFLVRADTTYSTGGRLVKREDLPAQTVVQIRAGRSFGGELEVYQITWGDILPAR